MSDSKGETRSAAVSALLTFAYSAVFQIRRNRQEISFFPFLFFWISRCQGRLYIPFLSFFPPSQFYSDKIVTVVLDSIKYLFLQFLSFFSYSFCNPPLLYSVLYRQHIFKRGLHGRREKEGDWCQSFTSKTGCCCSADTAPYRAPHNVSRTAGRKKRRRAKKWRSSSSRK